MEKEHVFVFVMDEAICLCSTGNTGKRNKSIAYLDFPTWISNRAEGSALDQSCAECV